MLSGHTNSQEKQTRKVRSCHGLRKRLEKQLYILLFQDPNSKSLSVLGEYSSFGEQCNEVNTRQETYLSPDRVNRESQVEKGILKCSTNLNSNYNLKREIGWEYTI